jgi:DNA-directed RNA polymerase specialized sigma24 family protein
VNGYTGRAWRENDWWVIDVDDVGATQAHTLDKVDHMARSLVADLTGAPYETVAVAVTIDLPPAVAKQLAALRAKTDLAAAQAQEATELQARLVHTLAADEGLTGREIAAILKVTPGRVSQIAKKTPPSQGRRTSSQGRAKSA